MTSAARCQLLDGHPGGESLCIAAAEAPEEAGVDQEFAKRGRDQSAEDDRGDWVENLAARFMAAPDERDQADACGQRRHQHGGQAFEAAAQDHLFGEAFAFMLH